jgi:hypothetical protein
LFEEGENVRGYEAVLGRVEIVESERFLGGCVGGVGDIDGGDVTGAAEGSGAGKSAGVAEEIENAKPFAHGANASSVLSLIEESSGLLAVDEVDSHFHRMLSYDDDFGGRLTCDGYDYWGILTVIAHDERANASRFQLRPNRLE